MLPGLPDPHDPDPALQRLDEALRSVAFRPPPTTWERVRRLLRAPGADIGLNRTTLLILLSFLVLALMIVGFYRVLTSLPSAGV